MEEGVRSWMLAFGAAVTFYIAHGSLKAMGVMMLNIADDFSSQLWIIGCITAAMDGTGCLFAMFTDVMCKQLHPRTVVIICGVMTCTGYIIASIASTLPLFAVILIFFSGIGQNIAHIITMGLLVEYFQDSFAMANSIANTGSSLAILTIAPLAQYLNDHYSWRGGMLIFGAMSAHIIACGLIIPVRESRVRLVQPQQKDGPIKEERESTVVESKRGLRSRSSSIITNLPSTIHVSLFLNIHFTVHIVSWFAANYSQIGWIIYLIPCMEKKGISPSLAVVLASAGGFSNLFGRFIGALLIDRKIIPVAAVQIVSFTLSGTLLICHFVFDSFIALFAITIVYGCVIGISWLTLYCQIKVILGPDMVIPGLSWSSLSGAISSYLVGVVSGKLDERFGDLDVAFVVLGIPMLIAALLVALTMRCSGRQDSASLQYEPLN